MGVITKKSNRAFLINIDESKKEYKGNEQMGITSEDLKEEKGKSFSIKKLTKEELCPQLFENSFLQFDMRHFSNKLQLKDSEEDDAEDPPDNGDDKEEIGMT